MGYSGLKVAIIPSKGIKLLFIIIFSQPGNKFSLVVTHYAKITL